MNQSLRPGVTLELLAGITLTAPSGGKVSAAITIPSPPGQRACFYKLQVRGL